MDNQERFENVCLGYSIQAERLKLKQASGKYHKHIKNSVYCQQLLRPYISKLQKIIAEVDALIGTGDKHEQEH